MKYIVELVEIASGEVNRQLEYSSEHLAEKALMNVLHNLSTERYVVRIREEAGDE